MNAAPLRLPSRADSRLLIHCRWAASIAHLWCGDQTPNVPPRKKTKLYCGAPVPRISKRDIQSARMPSPQKQTWLDRMTICWVITRRAPFTPRRKQRLSSLKRPSRRSSSATIQPRRQSPARLPSRRLRRIRLLRRVDPANDSVFSRFQLSDVCNTTHQFFLRHNHAARKSKSKMQSALVRRKSGGC